MSRLWESEHQQCPHHRSHTFICRKFRLHNVDQYLNIKLLEAKVVDPQRYPQLTAMTSVFIRGSVVRYITIPKEDVDVELLQDAARKAGTS